MKKSIIKIIAVVMAILCIGALVACDGNIQNDETSTESTTTTTTTTTTTSTTVEDETSSTTETTTETTTEKTTENTTEKTTFTYNTSITVNEAINALQDYYGDEYSVNGGSQENNIKYFTIRDANDERYASVSVNLDTGEATETITATNKTSTFSLHG